MPNSICFIKPVGWIFLFLLLSFSSAEAQFTLYQGVFEPGVPSLTPYAQKYTLDYGAVVASNTCTPKLSNIQQYANNGLSAPSTPVSFDVELNQGWPAYTTTAFTDSLNNYIQIINDFKAINTTTPVGFYSVPPPQVYNTYSNVTSSYAPTAQAMTPLANAVDYYSPDFYNYGGNDTADWRKAVDTALAVIREYYPTKPIYPYISPGVDNPDSATWLYNLQYLYAHTQGALIWTGTSPNWDPNASWWRCTKMFLVSKGLVPPFILDNFSVAAISVTGNTLSWTTSTDTISQYMVIQRSTDSVHYTTVSGHISRPGYYYNLTPYSFFDSTVVATDGQAIYYRLAITDTHNNVTYSSVLTYTKNLYRSSGGGVTVDLDSARNWQVYNGAAWVAATAAPETNLATGDTLVVKAGDTFQAVNDWTILSTGAVLIDSGSVGTISWGFTNYGVFEFIGSSAQTVPGTDGAEAANWGNLMVNDPAGVTITQADNNIIHIRALTLSAGTLTVSTASGQTVGLYLDSTVTGSGGHLAVTGTGVNEGVFLDCSTTAQSLPSGAFLNNRVSTLTLSNGSGVSYGGPLTVTNNTHLTRQATFAVGGNYSLDSLTLDTLGTSAALVVSGTATLAGVLTITSFATAPSPGQQYTIISAGGLSGSFSSVKLPAGCNGTVSSVGNNLVLTIAQPQLISGAVYKITTSLNNSSSLDVTGGNPANLTKVQLYQNDSTAEQQWKAVSVGGGYFKFESMLDTTKCLDVNGASSANGTQVDIYSDNGTNAQQWLPTPLGGNYYTLSPACSTGSVLDDSAAYTGNGSKIQIYTANGSSAQQWLFQMISGQADLDSLVTTADAFVKSATPTTNYGTWNYLAAWNDYYESYMKFNISSITDPVTSAKLRLYNQSSVTTTWQLYKVADSGNGWTETGINWNNQPAADTLLATFNASPSDTGFVYFDITSKLDSLLATAGGTISFKLVSTTATYDAFASRETGVAAQRPTLMLNRTVPLYMDSAADIADAFVKSTTAATNYGTWNYLAAWNDFYNSYVKFDLHGMKGKVLDAKLRLYSLAGASTQWQVYKVNSNAWTETGINWNNQPGGDTLLASISAPAAAGYVYWDIPAGLQYIGSDSVLSLEVVATASVYCSFSSKEGTPSLSPLILYTEDTNKAGTLAVIPTQVRTSILTPDGPDTAAVSARLLIYPNPIRDNCFIQSPEPIRTIEVYDNRGRLVRAVGGLCTYQYTVSLGGLAPGIYYIRLNNEPVRRQGKVLKTN